MFGPVTWQPTIAEYIEARHSQSGFTREWMGDELVKEFDRELGTLLARQFQNGRCQIDISFTVAWGTPSSPVSS